MVDPDPADLADVQEAVDAAEVDERPEVLDRLDPAGAGVATCRVCISSLRRLPALP